MRDRIIVDTGILVSLLDQREQWSNWAIEKLRSVAVPLYTCEAVLSETWFLTRTHHSAWPTITNWLRAGYLQVPFSMKDHTPSVISLIKKYQDLPMSVADACLVSMIENDLGDRIFTLDLHFKIYRHSGRRIVPVLMP